MPTAPSPGPGSDIQPAGLQGAPGAGHGGPAPYDLPGRNLNATKALLLGLYAEGVRNVLLVTGDPVPTAERDEVKSVYQFNSRKLASFVSSLGEQVLPQPFHLFGALNVNAVNFDVQLKLAREKLERGMAGFLTQPVLTPKGFENLKRARSELSGAWLLGGIIPVVSARNARFMDSEINGINVDPRITELYEGKGQRGRPWRWRSPPKSPAGLPRMWMASI